MRGRPGASVAGADDLAAQRVEPTSSPGVSVASVTARTAVAGSGRGPPGFHDPRGAPRPVQIWL